MNPAVDQILIQGCGRCSLVGTPQCKVNRWREILMGLRELLLETQLEETVKWGQPCYTLKDKNVALIHGFKEYCAIMFFKGAVLEDPEQILTQQTENVQSSRQFRFSSLKEFNQNKSKVQAFIQQAIDAEKTGKKIELKSHDEFAIPQELQERLSSDTTYRNAFERLTPGRQRAYYLFFAQAKQEATRKSRIEKMLPKIQQGKGPNER
jgi:uncharacterized protein YdeI (YjbR/CyaY-like superfamily)